MSLAIVLPELESLTDESDETARLDCVAARLEMLLLLAEVVVSNVSTVVDELDELGELDKLDEVERAIEESKT